MRPRQGGAIAKSQQSAYGGQKASQAVLFVGSRYQAQVGAVRPRMRVWVGGWVVLGLFRGKAWVCVLVSVCLRAPPSPSTEEKGARRASAPCDPSTSKSETTEVNGDQEGDKQYPTPVLDDEGWHDFSQDPWKCSCVCVHEEHACVCISTLHPHLHACNANLFLWRRSLHPCRNCEFKHGCACRCGHPHVGAAWHMGVALIPQTCMCVGGVCARAPWLLMCACCHKHCRSLLHPWLGRSSLPRRSLPCLASPCSCPSRCGLPLRAH